MDIELMMKALGDRTRFGIFRRLLERKHCVRSLAREMNITESAVSQHLKVLREAGLVYGEKYGYHTHYMPKTEALEFLAGEFSAMKKASEAPDALHLSCTCTCDCRNGGMK